MNVNYLPFNNQADLLVKNVSDRACIVGAAIAVAISKDISFPTMPVDNVESYYINHVLSNVRYQVSDWNENCVFNMKECLDLVRSFWYVRYYAAYPGSIAVYPTSLCFFNSLFNVDSYFSQETQKCFEENRNEILQLSSVASSVLNAIKEQK